MSKSLGNFFTVRDLLDGNTADGVRHPGPVIRFIYLSTHYRKPMDWTAKKAEQALDALSNFMGIIDRAVEAGEITRAAVPQHVDQRIIEALSDDLNTAQAIAVLHQLAKEKNAIGLLDSLDFLGFDRSKIESYWAGNDVSVAFAALTSQLSALRAEAMTTKNFAPVDALKSALTAAGVEVRMSKAGVELLPGPGFDPAKLEALK